VKLPKVKWKLTIFLIFVLFLSLFLVKVWFGRSPVHNLGAKNSSFAKTYRLAVILANFPDSKVEPKTKEEVDQIVFGPNNSVRDFYQKNSHNSISLEGEVKGWFTLLSPLPTCNTHQWGLEALNIARQEQVDIDNYDYRVVVLSDYSQSCPAWEYAYYSEKMIVVNASALSLLREISHELGHHLGAQHAHLLRCPNTIESIDKCRIENTQDPYDIMGYKDYPCDFSAANKLFLGLLPDSSLVTVSKTGTYSIKPLEGQKGRLVLKVKRPQTHDAYLISYRQRLGYDSFIPPWETLEGASIQIIQEGQTSNSEPLLVDAHPDIAFEGDANMSDGQEIYDSLNNISIKQLSHNKNSLELKITIGP
jgi:hypothetical protein